MDSPEISRTIRARRDEREEAHIRSFTKWINSKLSKAQPKTKISDLFNDLRNGHVLLSLLEVLRHEKLPREKGKLRVHHISNVNIVLQTLAKDNIKLYGISEQAIADGVHKSTMGLVWSIILRYQVHGAMMEEEETAQSSSKAASSAATTTRKISKPQSEAAVEGRLLQWVQNATEGYGDVIEVKDLSKSWRDGKAFNLLIHVHRNDLVDMDQVERMSNRSRLEHAFSVAEDHLNVQKLLEPSDVDQDNPDKKLVMMYVSSLYESLRQYEPEKKAKRRKVVEEEMVASASADVESSIPVGTPSDLLLVFKDVLNRTSTHLLKVEDEFAKIEEIFRTRVDAEILEDCISDYLSVESDIEQLNEMGKKTASDPSVSPVESKEIQSDLKAIDIRWSSLRNQKELQEKRVKSYKEIETKELNKWRTQADLFLNWIDKIDEQFDKIEQMRSRDDLDLLTEQEHILKDLLSALNNEPISHEVMAFGKNLVTRNVLSRDNQTKVKEELIELEKELTALRARADEDTARFNSTIDNLKQTQLDKMKKWREEAEGMCDWLDQMEDQLDDLNSRSGSADIKDIIMHLDKCEKLLETMNNDGKPRAVVEYGEVLMAEKTLSSEQKVKIGKQLTEIKSEWKALIAKTTEAKNNLLGKREESELEEKHKVEEWIRKFELLLKQMTRVKETVRKLSTLAIVAERYRAFQECIKVIESIKLEYQETVKCGEEVMGHDACPDWEKSQVSEDVELLKTTWKSVVNVIDDEGRNINALLSEAADQQVEKVNQWREKYKEVDQWYNSISPKIEGSFSVGKALRVVRKQIKDQEEISSEMVTTHESIEFLLASGQDLMRNPDTPDNEKNKLRKDIASLVERWESLSDTINNRLQRLAEMEKHLLENLAGKLDEWASQVSSVQGSLTREEKKFLAMGGIAPNLEAAIKQKPKVEVLMKEMKQEEKKFTAVLGLGEELLSDSSLSEEDNGRLQQELNTLKNRWQALEEKINWRIQRLDETISRLGSQQEDKLEKWRENAAQISDWLDKAQLKLAERGAIGSDLKSVSSQKENFQVFLDESLDFQRRIYGFTEFSENLRTDPVINEEERSKVQQKTKALNERWDVIVQQINNHHNALEEQLEDLEDKHKEEVLGRWNEKYEPFSLWLENTENTVKALKEIGDNPLLVKRQQDETKVLISEVAQKEPDFNDVISIAKMVNDDALIDDNEANEVEKIAESLTGRWVAVNELLNGRLESLRIRGSFFSEQEEHLLHEWRRNIEPFSNWLSKVEDDGAYEVNESVGVNSIKDYSVRCKTLEREVEGRKPVLEEILKLGGKLVADNAVSEEETVHIQEEMEILEERWKKLHVRIHDNTKWADIRLIELAKKEQETLDVWRKNVEPFSVWLEETSNKLEEIQKNSLGTESLEERHVALQRVKEDVTRHEEALARIVTIVGKLTDDENVSETEKNNIKAEMNRLKEKWNNNQNNVNLNYLSITEALMELAQKEKATLERWKKESDPLKEWIVEAKGRLDNLQRGEGYDEVQERQEKVQSLSHELGDHEPDYEKISKLRNDILMDESLSASFKSNVKDEGDSLDRKWTELSESITSQENTVEEQMVTLVNSQTNVLARWQEVLESLAVLQTKSENDLNAFESLALDLDGAKQQLSQLKSVEVEIQENRVQVEQISSMSTELSRGSKISSKKKIRVQEEARLMKERQNSQEMKCADYQRRLYDKVRELCELQSSKLEKWQTSSQPLHEWLDGIDEDAKEFDVIGGSIAEVHSQFDDLERLFKEFQGTEPDLLNVLKLGEDLSSDAEVSVEVRESVSRDVMALHESHENVVELLKSQREKMKSQLLKLQQHQDKCLIDWNERKIPVDVRVKAMEKRTSQWQAIGDTIEEVQSQIEISKAIEDDLESLRLDVTAVAQFGNILLNDKCIFEKKKEAIQAEIKLMEEAFESSRNSLDERKLSLNSRVDELKKARASEFLSTWQQCCSVSVRWMDTCEEAMSFDVEEEQTLLDVIERLSEVDDLSVKVEAFEPEFSATVKCGEDVINEPSVESRDKDEVERKLLSLKGRWLRINQNLDSLMSRLEDLEQNLSQKHKEDAARWQEDVQDTKDWCRDSRAKLESLDKNRESPNYDKMVQSKQELQILIEILPKYEKRIKELGVASQELAKNCKDRSEREKFINDSEAVQKDFNDVKIYVERAKSSYDVMITEYESVHGQQLSDWNKRGERIDEKLREIQAEWELINFLENSDKEQIELHRPQLEAVVSNLNSLQPDYERHCSVGQNLSKDPALSAETRDAVNEKLKTYDQRWESLQVAKKLYLLLPRLAVDETVVKIEEKQIESADVNIFDDLFGDGIDSTDYSVCEDLRDWQVDYDSSLKWCSDIDAKVTKRKTPGEYIILVERQHREIEEIIQQLTSYETIMSKILDRGHNLLGDAEALRLSKDERLRLDNDLRALKTKWDDLQENAFDTERSLNKHLNKLREFQDWQEKAGALTQWLEVTDRKMDCCSLPSEDLEERNKQKLFLQKFAAEKVQNEESINDVFNLGRYIVTNHLVLKENFDDIDNDIAKFKSLWKQMLCKADQFCKLFGVPFSHIDVDSLDPLTQWREKVKEVEKWIAEAHERLSLRNNIKNYAVLKTLPDAAIEIAQGIDNFCVPQLNEITSKGQDILNGKDADAKSNAEISDTIARLSSKVKALRQFTESQKVHVRNATLAFFATRLNSYEVLADTVLEDLKKLRTVGTEETTVRDQVDLIKNSEDNLRKYLSEFQESQKQILEMEDKGLLSTEGFEGTLRIKAAELEPRLLAIEREFADTKNKLSKGLVNFHTQHKDDVKKWLRQCDRKLNEIDSDVDDINSVYEEYIKLQELRRHILKGELSFLNTLELNERLIAEAMLGEQKGREYRGEMQAMAKWRNQIQRRIQEKNARLYSSLVEGLNGMLATAIDSFETAKAALGHEQLSSDFETAIEQMDGAKRIAVNIDDLALKAQSTIDLAQKITSCGILILDETDKNLVQGKIRLLKEYAASMPGKSHSDFNRLLDDFLSLFKKEIEERKTWITVNENRMSSNYLETEDLAAFQKELDQHKDFEQELSHRNMTKMADAADRVTELENKLKIEVKNLEKRWRVLKQWSDEYSLDLKRIVKEWRVIKQEYDLLVEWLNPREEQLAKISEKINWADTEGLKQQIEDLKKLQAELEDKGVVLSNSHVKGMELMKFLHEETAGSRTIDRDLAQLDRRWNSMAKEILARIELLRNIQYKQADIKRQKKTVNTYIDETNADLDEHETKTQRLRGNVSPEMENGETAREKKTRLKKEKEVLEQDVVELIQRLDERISDFPKYQVLVDRINGMSQELENVADEESKTVLHDELVNFNARWQVIVTRLEDYSDNELPDHTSFGCMGFVRRRLSRS